VSNDSSKDRLAEPSVGDLSLLLLLLLCLLDDNSLPLSSCSVDVFGDFGTAKLSSSLGYSDGSFKKTLGGTTDRMRRRPVPEDDGVDLDVRSLLLL